MSPPYAFRIDEIRESDDAFQTYDQRGNWVPSVEKNANVRVRAGVSQKWWYCDGLYFREQPQFPPGCVHYKTYSVYYSAGFGFWVLRGDATNVPEAENWHPLRFDWDPQNYSSVLTNAGLQSTLRWMRNDQNWPRLLLPDIYHTHSVTENQQYGGLKGELGIFLALLALSTSSDYLYNVLPTLFYGGHWVGHNYSMPRISGRGVIVSIYTAPQLSQNSTATELYRYEQGLYGLYFH